VRPSALLTTRDREIKRTTAAVDYKKRRTTTKRAPKISESTERTTVVWATNQLGDTKALTNNQFYIQCESKNSPLRFSEKFSQTVGDFSANFIRLLHVAIYARSQIFIQISPTVTKLCHIKCDHPACVSADSGHFEHYDVIM